MLTPDVKPGAFIAFSYNPPAGTPSRDASKEVMVLNPNYQNLCHAIDLKRVTPAERMVLQMIMDPKTKENMESIPYPLVRDVLTRMDPVEVVKSPMRFYQAFVRPFLRQKDAYRKYFPIYMQGVRVIQASQVQGSMKPFVPAPSFKPLFKPTAKPSPFKKI